MRPVRGGAEGRAGNRLHRAHHQHLAGRRVHSAAADGRHRRPAVPRIRRHALGRHRRLDGGFADHHADDVRAPAEGARSARLALPDRANEFFNWIVDLYGKTLDRRAAATPFVTLLVLLATIGLNVYLFIRVPKGFFPQQDNGRLTGQIHGRSGHFVSSHGQDAAADGEHRRPPTRRSTPSTASPAAAAAGAPNHGAHVHLAEAARRNARSRVDQIIAAAAAEAGPSARRDALSAGRRRICASAAATATRCISSPCAATICRI